MLIIKHLPHHQKYAEGYNKPLELNVPCRSGRQQNLTDTKFHGVILTNTDSDITV